MSWHRKCKRTGIELAATRQKIDFNLRFPIHYGHLGTGILFEAIHAQLVTSQLHVGHDNVDVHREAWITMFLNGESPTDVVGNVKESQHLHGLDERLFDIRRATGFSQELRLFMKLKEGLHTFI